MAQVSELRERAVRTNGAGRPAQAVRLLDTALKMVRAVPDSSARRTTEAWVLVSRADPVLELRGLDPALSDVADAVALAGDTAFVSALAHSQRAMLFGRSGDLNRAEAELRAAIDQKDALPPYNQWVLMINRGMLRMERHELDGARGDLGEARAVALAHGLAVPAFKATHNLAYTEFLAGELSRALALMQRAAAEADDIPGELQLVLLMDEARMLMECGLFAEADDRLARAADLARRERAGQSAAEIALTRARVAVARGDTRAARNHAARARARFLRRGAVARGDEAELLAVEAALAAGSGRGAARRAERVLDRQPPERVEAIRSAALLAAEGWLRAGDPDPARPLFARADGAGHRLPTSARLHTDLVRAQLEAAGGKPGRARSVLRRSAAQLAEAQARMSSLDLRTAIAVHGRRLSDFDLDLALRSGDARQVLEASERWRAVSSRLAPVVAASDPEAAALMTELRSVHAAWAEAPADQRDRFRIQAARLEAELRRRDWGSGPDAGIDAVGPVLDLTHARTELRARSADLVSYVVHRGRVLAVTGPGTGRNRLVLHDLGAAEVVRDLVARIRADLRALAGGAPNLMLQAAIRGSLQDGLARLDAVMLAPLELTASRLVVVPARTLVSVPWSMLPSRTGAPTTVAQSLSTWMLRSTGTPRPGVGAAVAIAGPGLEFADTEVRAVARTWRSRASGRSVSAGRSRTAVLADALRTDRVVHVAAHGRHNAQSPLFSSLRMADGELFAHELQQQGVGAEHVVLSACDVGESTIRPGEESLGLTASLLALGARCVVAPVTPVPDDVACALMTRYHRELVRGVDAAAALADAGAEHELAGAFCVFGGDWTA